MSSARDFEHVPDRPREHENIQIVLFAQLNAPWVNRIVFGAGALIRIPNVAAGGLHVIANIVTAAAKMLAEDRPEEVSSDEHPRLVVTAERVDISKSDTSQQH